MQPPDTSSLRVCLKSFYQWASLPSGMIAEAAQRKTSTDAIVALTSLASRRLRLIQAKSRSPTQRRACTANPTWLLVLRTIFTRIKLAAAVHGPW